MDVEKALSSRKDFDAGYDSEYESSEKKILKEGKSFLRLKGDFCISYRVWISCIKEGEEKRLPFVIAQKQIDGSYIKSPLLDLLTGGTFMASDTNYKDGLYEYKLEGEKGSRKRNYVHSDTDIFTFFATNGEGEFDGYSLAIRPQAEVVINCIDREDKEWHLNEKSCKLLCKSKSTIGVSSSIWESMLAVFENNGDPEEYDILISKQKINGNTKYSCQRATTYVSDLVIEGSLTEEEKKYKEYDVYKESKVSSANYILKYLGDRIKEADEVLGTDYYTQLKEQCVSNEDDEGIEKTKETVEQIVTSTRRTRKKKEESNEKEMDFGDLQVEECLNSNCKKEFPVEWDKCPFCGEEYNLD